MSSRFGKGALTILILSVWVAPAGFNVVAQEAPANPAASETSSKAAQNLLQLLGLPDANYSRQGFDALVRDLLRNRDQRLIPYYEDQLAESEGALWIELPTRAKLVFLGSEDPEHWERLSALARDATTSDMPALLDPARQDERGRRQLSAAAVAWLEESGMSTTEAHEQFQRHLIALTALGSSADPRTFDILVECLRSPNQNFILVCTKGLARLQDERAIEPIIAVVSRFPYPEKTLVAKYLLYFDTPVAQHAADRIISDEAFLREQRKRIAEIGLERLYGY